LELVGFVVSCWMILACLYYNNWFCHLVCYPRRNMLLAACGRIYAYTLVEANLVSLELVGFVVSCWMSLSCLY
jgi:hypothetical protein